MNTQEAVALADMFNVRKGQEDRAFQFLDTMEKEIRHLATKEDLADLEIRISSKFQTQFYWFVGLFVTVLLGFIATLFTLLQMQGSGSISVP